MYSLRLNTPRVHDTEEHVTIDALAASGDCFVTLASQIDQLTHEEQRTHHNSQLEQIVRTLIYLQQHYAVVKKQANYRQ